MKIRQIHPSAIQLRVIVIVNVKKYLQTFLCSKLFLLTVLVTNKICH